MDFGLGHRNVFAFDGMPQDTIEVVPRGFVNFVEIIAADSRAPKMRATAKTENTPKLRTVLLGTMFLR
jgi:hypothetical protein